MKTKRVLASTVLGLGLALGNYNARADSIKINEAVTDPQVDRDGSGTIGAGDEFFELYNPTNSAINLEGWTLEMIDGTPAIQNLSGSIETLSYSSILNPMDQMNNTINLYLKDNLGSLVDSLQILDGNANNPSDESVSRFPDGGLNIVRTYATYNGPNVPEPATCYALTGLVALASRRRR